MSTTNERLAILETQVEQIIEEGHRREETQAAILKELRTAKDSLNEMRGELLRYKGFLGGIAFVASCIGVFLYKFVLPVYNLILKVKSGG